MATVHLYLDKRHLRGGEAQIKVGINKKGSSAYLPLGIWILPSQWDSVKERVKDNKSKNTINSFIQSRKLDIQRNLMELTSAGKLTKMTATQIKNVLAEIIEPSETGKNLFIKRFTAYADTRVSQSTKEKYYQTLKRILQFCDKARSLTFEDITKDWLEDFDRFLSKYNTAKNGRNIHFRNIRAVFNDAIDNEVTTAYPFRKFKIRPEETEKRSLTVEQLRALFNCEVEPWQQRYLDMFKLSFFLIGINVSDLCNLEEVNAEGYIVYRRAKTHKLYRIKVEPEAQEIIDRYRGRSKLLNLLDGISSAKTFMMKMDRGLKTIGECELVHNNKWKSGTRKHKYVKRYKPLFPKLTSYWARHTWATIASELDIPNETISAALGHSITNKTTAIYIDYNRSKVDAANRLVMDYVLGIGKFAQQKNDVQ